MQVSRHTERKHAAVAAYSSQIRALEARAPHLLADVLAPERYWRLVAGRRSYSTGSSHA